MKIAFIKNHVLWASVLVGTMFIAHSCSTTKNISYFQDLQGKDTTQAVIAPTEIRIRPEDKISILVNSRDPQLADLFNLPIVPRQVGVTTQNGGYRTSQGMSGYTVDNNGDIDFPVLGKIHIAGMNRVEIAEFIKNELISKNLVKDPIVTVEYINLTVSVFGEVAKPGKYDIDRDKITIMDALSMAGDLTIYGKRENVLVMRKEGGEERIYSLNLCSARDVYSSPAYYLQQNDVIYVEPNKVRARQSTVNGNNIRSTSFWISLASLLTSAGILISNNVK